MIQPADPLHKGLTSLSNTELVREANMVPGASPSDAMHGRPPGEAARLSLGILAARDAADQKHQQSQAQPPGSTVLDQITMGQQRGLGGMQPDMTAPPMGVDQLGMMQGDPLRAEVPAVPAPTPPMPPMPMPRPPVSDMPASYTFPTGGLPEGMPRSGMLPGTMGMRGGGVVNLPTDLRYSGGGIVGYANGGAITTLGEALEGGVDARGFPVDAAEEEIKNARLLDALSKESQRERRIAEARALSMVDDMDYEAELAKQLEAGANEKVAAELADAGFPISISKEYYKQRDPSAPEAMTPSQVLEKMSIERGYDPTVRDLATGELGRYTNVAALPWLVGRLGKLGANIGEAGADFQLSLLEGGTGSKVPPNWDVADQLESVGSKWERLMARTSDAWRKRRADPGGVPREQRIDPRVYEQADIDAPDLAVVEREQEDAEQKSLKDRTLQAIRELSTGPKKWVEEQTASAAQKVKDGTEQLFTPEDPEVLSPPATGGDSAGSDPITKDAPAPATQDAEIDTSTSESIITGLKKQFPNNKTLQKLDLDALPDKARGGAEWLGKFFVDAEAMGGDVWEQIPPEARKTIKKWGPGVAATLYAVGAKGPIGWVAKTLLSKPARAAALYLGLDTWAGGNSAEKLFGWFGENFKNFDKKVATQLGGGRRGNNNNTTPQGDAYWRRQGAGEGPGVFGRGSASEEDNQSLFDRLSRAQKQEGVNAINQRYGAGTTDMGDLRRLLTRTALNWGAGRNIGESALLAFEQDVNEQTAAATAQAEQVSQMMDRQIELLKMETDLSKADQAEFNKWLKERPQEYRQLKDRYLAMHLPKERWFMKHSPQKLLEAETMAQAQAEAQMRRMWDMRVGATVEEESTNGEPKA